MVRYAPFNYLGLRTRQRRAQYCRTVLEHFRVKVAAVWARPAQLDSGRLMALAVTQLVKSPLAGFRTRCMSPVSPTYQPLVPKPACQLSTDSFGLRKERVTSSVCFSYCMTEALRFKFSLLLKTDHFTALPPPSAHSPSPSPSATHSFPLLLSHTVSLRRRHTFYLRETQLLQVAITIVHASNYIKLWIRHKSWQLERMCGESLRWDHTPSRLVAPVWRFRECSHFK